MSHTNYKEKKIGVDEILIIYKKKQC